VPHPAPDGTSISLSETSRPPGTVGAGLAGTGAADPGAAGAGGDQRRPAHLAARRTGPGLVTGAGPRGPAAHALARAGLAARGVIYILIGWVAVLVATGRSSPQADQQGALQMLAGTPYGVVSLWLLCIGFAGYVLWRLSEAAFGVTGEGTRAGPRARSLARATVYAFLCYLSFSIIQGTHSSQAGREQDLTATVMHHQGGRWLVAAAGLVIAAAGLAMVAEGLRHRYMRYLRTAQMTAGTRRVVRRLGVIGTVARGLVSGLTGVLVIDAAVTSRPAEARGLDKALLTLLHRPGPPQGRRSRLPGTSVSRPCGSSRTGPCAARLAGRAVPRAGEA